MARPNPFAADWVAPRYADARPDVHSAVVEHLRGFVAARGGSKAALDLGCGTGLSTRPLATLTGRAVGLDPSPAMLREAARRGGAHFVRGVAEALPFPAAAFDLVTIGCAYHWCDTEALLAEVRRVLAPAGHFALYDSFFLGGSADADALLEWLRAEHWARLPMAPRNPLPEMGRFDRPGFELVDFRFLEAWIPTSRERLVAYLTTQSGVTTAVESGVDSVDEIEASLRAGLADRYPATGGSMHFGGPLWLVRRLG